MFDFTRITEFAKIVKSRLFKSDDQVQCIGVFTLEHWRNGKCIGVKDVQNLVTTEGKNKMIDVMFHSTTQITAWFIGIINASGFTAVAAGDTMASHAGWTELTVYDEATRQAWDEAAASGGSGGTTTPSVFTFNATCTVKGMFLCSNSTKSGTTGTIWCATPFASDSPFIAGDEGRVTYTPTLT